MSPEQLIIARKAAWPSFEEYSRALEFPGNRPQAFHPEKSEGLAFAPEKPATAKDRHINKVIAYAQRMLPYYKWRKTIRFLFNATLHAGLYQKWFAYVEKGLPKSASFDVACLAQKPSLRYLRLWFSQREKMRIICSHYGIMNALFPPEALTLIHNSSGVPLAELTGKSGRKYQIAFQQYATKEGEIAIHFMDTELGMPLATIRGAFSIEADGSTVFWIGSLQGPPPPYGRKEVSIATRDLYTLRPKQAVLHAICALCAWVGVRSIYAPRRQNHVSQSWRRSWFRRGKIFADYDQFWEENSKRITPWDDFEISLPLPRRQLSDVQPKRRKEWTKRYSHIDTLMENAAIALDALAHLPASESGDH